MTSSVVVVVVRIPCDDATEENARDLARLCGERGFTVLDEPMKDDVPAATSVEAWVEKPQ